MAATIIENGDIWDAFGNVDMFCFCCGVQYDPETEGIMMRDQFQLQILKKMPDIDIILWKRLERFLDKSKMDQLDYRPYAGLVYAKNKKYNQVVALFQNKGLWIDDPNPLIVANSFSELVKFTLTFIAASGKPPTIVMDNPAQGSAKLVIETLYDYLPSNIVIYKNRPKNPNIKSDTTPDEMPGMEPPSFDFN